MPTTVIKKIGSAGGGTRDYSTLQAWEDACPANLVAADQIWRGECYNDSEFTAGCSVGGETTDSTRYLELTAAAGESFQDKVGVRSNALTYNQSNGVGIRLTGVWAMIWFATNLDTHVSRIQFKTTQTTSRPLNGQRMTIKDCLFDHNYSSYMGADASFLRNCVVIQRNSAAPGFTTGNSSAVIEGCTIIKPSDVTPGGTGLVVSYGTIVVKSNAIFGFTTATSGSFDAASGYNATNLASGLPGSNNQYNVSYSRTTPFTDAQASTLDARAVAATALAANGYRDSTNAPNDISGFARPTPPTIGAWQLGASGTTQTLAGTTAALSSATVAAAAVRRVAGTTAASSSATVAARALRRVVGTTAALASATVAARALRRVVGTTAALSSATVAAAAVRRVAGATAGVSSTSGLAVRRMKVAGTAGGAAASTASARGVFVLLGSAAGHATAGSAILQLITRVVAQVSGIATGTAAATGTLRPVKGLAGVSGGVATGTSSLRGQLGLIGWTGGTAAALALLGACRLFRGITGGYAAGAGRIASNHPAPLARTVIVPIEGRAFRVPAESRVYTVLPEQREFRA